MGSPTNKCDADSAGRRTWNSPEDIERHRRMTPEERLRQTIAVSRAALRFASGERAEPR